MYAYKATLKIEGEYETWSVMIEMNSADRFEISQSLMEVIQMWGNDELPSDEYNASGTELGYE